MLDSSRDRGDHGPIAVGTFVLNVVNRHPAVLARMAMTVADLAPGRVELGIGIGGTGQLAYGVDWPTVPERVARLEEAVTVLRLLFGGGPVSFAGRYFTLTDAVAFPVPTPAPRIVVAGQSSAGARLAARAGDAWTCPAELFERLLPIYREALGRGRGSGRRAPRSWACRRGPSSTTRPARSVASPSGGRMRSSWSGCVPSQLDPLLEALAGAG